MSVRLFHRGARLVLTVRRGAPGDARWWSPHLAPPDWSAILGGQLARLDLPARAGSDGMSLTCRIGEIHWTARCCWSIIALRLTGGSETKRRLVTAALMRAARYGRPERGIASTRGG